MARPRKYATVDELQQTEARLVEQIKANSPNGELKRIAQGMDRFEKIAEPLERIVAREERTVAKHEAWATVAEDVIEHIPAVLRKKVLWAGTAILASFYWFFGSKLAMAFGGWLHSHGIPGF